MTYKVLNAVTQKFAVKVPLEKKNNVRVLSHISCNTHRNAPINLNMKRTCNRR